MKLLLDTHALVWWWADDHRKLKTAVDLLKSPTNEIYVSAATVWEIAIKHRLGKLKLDFPPTQIPAALHQGGFFPLEMTIAHALQAGSYSADHADPFDRMLAAQAELEGLTLVTRDPAFAAFPCETLW